MLTEARASGSPIVASTAGGIPEALSNGRAGILVPPADHERLARALITVLQDADLADRLRTAGREGLEYMDVSRAERDYRAVYDSVVTEQGGR